MTPPSLPTKTATHVTTDEFKRAAEALRPDRGLRHPRLREAATLLQDKKFGLAAKLLREFLKDHPRDVKALYLMAETAVRHGREQDAEALLAQCVELAPEFAAARYAHAVGLLEANRPAPALLETEELLKLEPRNPLFRQLKAFVLDAMGDHAAAVVSWRTLIEDYPARQDCWLRYGHTLRATGLREDCISAYRTAIELDPSCGSAWWSLADLKTFRFGQAEVELMEIQLARSDLPAVDRTRIHFSLGKAYADRQLYEASFANYAKGNAIHRLGFQHHPDVLTTYVSRCKSLFTEEFFRAHAGSGHENAEPIFLVGMPRAGSTLIEQILASHSHIEGTSELSDLATISTRLQTDVAPKLGADYPCVLRSLDAATLRRLGEQYIEATRAHRKLDRPYFTDKMGPNYVHVGLLQLILPNAKIVDVRRHPLACCLSIFTQLFPKGQNDSYRLSDIGRHYRDYACLMTHFDRVLPGKVHRIFYERLVAEPESEIRRLLDYLGLPFEQACVDFHNTDRVVTTASSEQVRSPLYKDALEYWQNFEPWLQPLKAELGPLVDTYPDVPELI